MTQAIGLNSGGILFQRPLAYNAFQNEANHRAGLVAQEVFARPIAAHFVRLCRECPSHNAKQADLDHQRHVAFEQVYPMRRLARIEQQIQKTQVLTAEDVKWLVLQLQFPEMNALLAPLCKQTTVLRLHGIDGEQLRVIAEKFTNLQVLDIPCCKGLQNLDALQHLTQLRVLKLTQCKELTNLDALEHLTQLRVLNLANCGGVRDLMPVHKLSCLERLNLSHCDQVADLKPLKSLSCLQELNLSWCEGITDFTALGWLSNLKRLDLSCIDTLIDISFLYGIYNLEALNLMFCLNLQDLDGLIVWPGSLRELNLSGCIAVTDFTNLEELTNLQRLSLSFLNLTDLSMLTGLTQLRHLVLVQCRYLKDLTAIKTLDLHWLDTSDCGELEEIAPVASQQHLQGLILKNCKKINEFYPLSKLKNLQRLDLEGCDLRFPEKRLMQGTFPRLYSDPDGDSFHTIDFPTSVSGRRRRFIRIRLTGS